MVVDAWRFIDWNNSHTNNATKTCFQRSQATKNRRRSEATGMFVLNPDQGGGGGSAEGGRFGVPQQVWFFGQLILLGVALHGAQLFFTARDEKLLSGSK